MKNEQIFLYWHTEAEDFEKAIPHLVENLNFIIDMFETLPAGRIGSLEELQSLIAGPTEFVREKLETKNDFYKNSNDRNTDTSLLPAGIRDLKTRITGFHRYPQVKKWLDWELFTFSDFRVNINERNYKNRLESFKIYASSDEDISRYRAFQKFAEACNALESVKVEPKVMFSRLRKNGKGYEIIPQYIK